MNTAVAQIVIRDFPQDSLESYVKARLEDLYLSFETVKSEDLGALQGRITEVKLLLKIREHSQNVLNIARKG